MKVEELKRKLNLVQLTMRSELKAVKGIDVLFESDQVKEVKEIDIAIKIINRYT
jgi:hypothetical protein